MKRELIKSIYADQNAYGGKEITVGGWARSIRDSKAFGFIDLYDGSCFKTMQVVFESLRRDEFLRWGFVRCSELLSAVALFIVLLCYQLRSGRVWKKRHIACWIGYVVLVVSCILLEFATEERIPFLTFLSPEACYVCMTGCCALLCGCVMVMRSTEPVKS